MRGILDKLYLICRIVNLTESGTATLCGKMRRRRTAPVTPVISQSWSCTWSV